MGECRRLKDTGRSGERRPLRGQRGAHGSSASAALLALFALGPACGGLTFAGETRQATGVKVGEVTATSAAVWMRLTQNELREVADGSCPGADGQVRVRYGLAADFTDAVATSWVDVTSATDHTHQFDLAGLLPESTYYYSAETAGPGGTPVHGAVTGSFRTAPRAHEYADATFTVITGQQYEHLDVAEEGYKIYDAMAALAPHFIVPTGDTVYYDKTPTLANTVPLARWKWHRMYSLPKLRAFHLQAPGYWEKDDHDTLKNDCWPGQTYGSLTFDEGLAIFREQVPMSSLTYRTFRWGKALQVWLVEGRDYRSPNSDPDGPAKTIWGAVQKQWWKDTVLASDADWRVLVSPTPIVGPDRAGKNDNHANAAFQTEGDEIRAWIDAANAGDDIFICCGDRHWQYHSKYPDLAVHEFSSGPASDVHAGGSPGEDPAHLFHQVAGGFLAVSTSYAAGESTITFSLRDVDGAEVYSYSRQKTVGTVPLVAVTASDPDAAEAGLDPGEFTVSRAVVTGQPLSVDFTVSGSATESDDYDPVPRSVTIPADERSASFSVTPVDDGDKEGEEKATVTVTDLAAYDVYAPAASAEVRIADDDLPTVTISASDPAASEAGDPGAFVVTRSPVGAEELQVSLLVGGDATEGVDYAAIGDTVTIAPGQPSATITVGPVDDPLPESDETVTLEILTPAEPTYGVGSPSSGEVVIADDDRDPDLVLYYELNEAAGAVARDSSGNGRDGTVYGEVTPAWAPGHLGNALTFDGVDDFVDAGDPADGSLDFGTDVDFTISAWVNVAAAPADQYAIIGKGDGGGNPRLLLKVKASGALLFTVTNGNVNGAASVVGGGWRHVAASCDRDTAAVLYVDGSPDVTGGALADSITSASLFFVGKSESGGGRRFMDGLIDDVRVYRRALTEPEIVALRDMGPPPAVTDVLPASAAEGDAVTALGSGFQLGACVQFGFGDVSPSTTFVGAGELTAVVPAGTGSVDVIVTNPDGQSGTPWSAFLYSPRVDAVRPGLGGVAGGTTVTVTGVNLIDPVQVLFGAGPAASVTWVSATTLTAETPAAGAPGPVDVRVENPDGGWYVKAGGFTYSGGPGDLNGDGTVNLQDFAVIDDNWSRYPSDPAWDPRSDPTGDGVSNLSDLMVVARNWGTDYP